MAHPFWPREYVGIPFKERGRDRQGVDCWGLVRLVWRERFGLEVPSYTDLYETTEQHAELAEAITENGTESLDWLKIESGNEQDGDAILLRIVGHPIHVGMVIEPGLMLHCEQGHNSVIERYDGLKWRRRVLGFYRHHSSTE